MSDFEARHGDVVAIGYIRSDIASLKTDIKELMKMANESNELLKGKGNDTGLVGASQRHEKELNEQRKSINRLYVLLIVALSVGALVLFILLLAVLPAISGGF